jgi:hypothetical protein
MSVVTWFLHWAHWKQSTWKKDRLARNVDKDPDNLLSRSITHPKATTTPPALSTTGRWQPGQSAFPSICIWPSITAASAVPAFTGRSSSTGRRSISSTTRYGRRRSCLPAGGERDSRPADVARVASDSSNSFKVGNRGRRAQRNPRRRKGIGDNTTEW